MENNFTKEQIEQALTTHKTLNEAAKSLSISRFSLRRRIKKFNLNNSKSNHSAANDKLIANLLALQKENAELKERSTIFNTDTYQITKEQSQRRDYLVSIYEQKLKNHKIKEGKKSHFVLPDCQVKQGVDLSYLADIAQYIVAKKPDRIICIGDFGDFPSLSSYDKGKKSHEGKRYIADLRAVYYGMYLLMMPILEYIATHDDWIPTLDLTYGNHEERILRAINEASELEGTMAMEDCHYEKWGWTTHKFLKPVVHEDVAYAHYFTSGTMGRPVSSAKALVQKKHQSCVMGHVQDWQHHREVRGDGRPLTGLFVGACYLHNEDYLGPQGNNYERICWILHEVEQGSFQEHRISLDYLKRKYRGE